MKKASFVVASVLSLSALTLAPIKASADPIGLNVTIQCPNSKGSGETVITHFGDYIGGFGVEDIRNQGQKQIYFKSNFVAPNTPTDLTDYDNSDIQYDSSTGTVTCNYTNPRANAPLVTVSYTLINGKGGAIEGKSSCSILINLPVGLK